MFGLFFHIMYQLPETVLEIYCQAPVPGQVLFIRLITVSICIGAGDILKTIAFITFPLVSDDIIFLERLPLFRKVNGEYEEIL